MNPVSAAPAPPRVQVPTALLWFGVFGAPLVWSLQMLVNYAVAARNCRATPGRVGEGVGLEVVTLMLAGMIALAAGIVAWSAWRRSGGYRQSEPGEPREGRARFMAFAGLLLSGLFLLGILFDLIPILMMPACG